MLVKLAGNKKNIQGLSTLEIIIAIALMSIIITSAIQTIYMSQYWILGGEVSGEALSVAKTRLEVVRSLAQVDFYNASSSVASQVRPLSSASASLCATSFCYQSLVTVTDVSPCTKNVMVEVSWRISARYSTSSVELDTTVMNPAEVIARGGDCLLQSTRGNWLGPAVAVVGNTTRPAQFSSGLDVLGDYIYQTASSAPQLSIYRQPSMVGGNPVLVGSSTGMGHRLNAIDVIRDLNTGRTYAYVVQHASSSQLSVVDVTDVTNPVWVGSRSLHDVSTTSSFPQGWRVVAYGSRSYVLTRETAGPELHIFDITNPEQPTEIIGGIFNLNRTVNDLFVHEQLVAGVNRRFIILAASADTKELGIFEVTDDVLVELVAVNLPGTEDALSVILGGNTVYVGRRATSGGPELYQFNFPELLKGNTTPLATSEVGADVSTIRSSGTVLYLGTNRSGAEFQVWKSSAEFWSSTTPNAARISSTPVLRLARLGIELASDFVYAHSQSATQEEQLLVITTP